MTRLPASLSRALAFAWRHGSAAVALALIVGAALLGYALGRPAPEPEPGAVAAVSPADDAAPRMYTCSMHPAVRLPDPDAKCPICFMDLIPAPEGEDGANAARLAFSTAALAAARVETAAVGRFLPLAEVRLYGKVAVDETTVARITAYFPGRLERLFVNYVGVPVRRGEHLAEIYSPALLAAFEEIRQAHLAAETAGGSEIVRRTTAETLAAAREKLRLYGLTATQIEAAETGTRTGDAFTIYAPSGGIVTHLAAREGDYLQTGSPIATVADLARLWLDLEAYESQLPLLRWGQPVRFTVESHPGEAFEGRISFIEPMVDERTRTAAVRVAVDNADGRLKPGMFASAVVRTRVGAGGAVASDALAGRWVCPMHPTEVKDAAGDCAVCGMPLVTAESLGVVGDPAAVSEPLVIPRSAVLVTGRRAIAYVRVPETDPPQFEAREIVLGSRAGEHYVLEAGLEEGEEIVVRGAFRIDSAMQIAAKPSMMSATDADDDAETAAADALPPRFLDGLEPVFAAYLDGQEALADDDLAAFLAAAARLGPALDAVDATGLLGAPLADWRRAAAQLRSPIDGTTIDAARAGFETLSVGALDLARRFGHAGSAPWHHAYCPMAFDFKGAAWLQRGDEIDNPYFGAAMLRCGEIRRALPPRTGAGSDE